MIRTKESHVDHVSATIIEYILLRFADRNSFFIEEIELPNDMKLASDLYGPGCGDAPVDLNDVVWVRRNGRSGLSRCVRRTPRMTNRLVVIGGPDEEGNPCILYTCYGGPQAPREPWDPKLNEEQRIESETFWSVHALASSDHGFVNLTPHDLTIVEGETKLLLPRSGQVARLAEGVEGPIVRGGVSVLQKRLLNVVGLPDPAPYTNFVVSLPVRTAVPARLDVLSPGDLIRDSNGQPVGCKGLVSN